MASAEQRRAAGGSGIEVAPPDAPEPKKAARAKREKDLNDPAEQQRRLRPPQLECTLELESGPKRIVIPLEYTLHEIFNRRVLEDLDAYAMLVATEVRRIAPDLQSVGPELLTNNPGYFEAAVSRSGVRDMLRTVLARIARVEREDGEIERPSIKDLEDGLDDVEYLVCAIRLYTEVLRRRAAQQAKNRARTAPA